MSAYVVDIVLDGTGSVALLGPFRSRRAAERHSQMIERQVRKADLATTYYASVTDVESPRDWRQHVDLTDHDLLPVGAGE